MPSGSLPKGVVLIDRGGMLLRPRQSFRLAASSDIANSGGGLICQPLTTRLEPDIQGRKRGSPDPQTGGAFMIGAYDDAKPTLEPPNDLFYGALHTTALIDALEFPLHFNHARPRICWNTDQHRGDNLSTEPQSGCDGSHWLGSRGEATAPESRRNVEPATGNGVALGHWLLLTYL